MHEGPMVIGCLDPAGLGVLHHKAGRTAVGAGAAGLSGVGCH